MRERARCSDQQSAMDQGEVCGASEHEDCEGDEVQVGEDFG